MFLVNFKLLLLSLILNKIRYCSKDCQKEHWQDHKKTCVPPKKTMNTPLQINLDDKVIFFQKEVPSNIIPKGLIIKTTETQGRGVFSTQSFKKGEIIFFECPYVFCSQHDLNIEDDRECNYCNRPAPFLDASHKPYKPYNCRNNCSVVYCSSDCEKNAYKLFHEILCVKNKKSILGENGRNSLQNLRLYAKKSSYKYPLLVIKIIARYLSNVNHHQPWKHIWVPSVDMNDLQTKWEGELSLISSIFSEVPEASMCKFLSNLIPYYSN